MSKLNCPKYNFYYFLNVEKSIIVRWLYTELIIPKIFLKLNEFIILGIYYVCIPNKLYFYLKTFKTILISLCSFRNLKYENKYQQL